MEQQQVTTIDVTNAIAMITHRKIDCTVVYGPTLTVQQARAVGYLVADDDRCVWQETHIAGCVKREIVTDEVMNRRLELSGYVRVI